MVFGLCGCLTSALSGAGRPGGSEGNLASLLAAAAHNSGSDGRGVGGAGSRLLGSLVGAVCSTLSNLLLLNSHLLFDAILILVDSFESFLELHQLLIHSARSLLFKTHGGHIGT